MPMLYFYHDDHLGSSSFITDATGIAHEHLQYLPFGEVMVDDKRDVPYYTPYKFSGKELDDETQYSYFGARYYDSDLSVWLSVDPLAGKFNSTSPYMYCIGNPVRLIDPNGMDTSFANKRSSMEFRSTYKNVTNKIDYYNSQINTELNNWKNSGYNDDNIKDKITKLNKSRSKFIDIKNSFDDVINSPEMYYYESRKNPDGFPTGGGTVWNEKNNRYESWFYEGMDGSVVHEVRHGAGYFRGELKKGSINLYDYDDEFQAFYQKNVYLNGIYLQEMKSDIDWRLYIISNYHDKVQIQEFNQICK